MHKGDEKVNVGEWEQLSEEVEGMENYRGGGIKGEG